MKLFLCDLMDFDLINFIHLFIIASIMGLEERIF